MGNKKKTVLFDCRNRITELRKKKGMEADLDLLREMAKYMDIGDMNRYGWAEKNRTHFSEKISGKRAFTLEEICALERSIGVAYADIVAPAEVPIKMTKHDFQPSGIRYAAYCDSPELYGHLMAEVDAYGDSVFYNSDEFEKYLLDYIVEYNAQNGLRFMIETDVPDRKAGLLYFDVEHSRWEGNFHGMERLNEGLWRMLMDTDDAALFKRATSYNWRSGPWHSFCEWSEDREEAYLPPLLCTKEIKECALMPFKEDGNPNVFLVLILRYALRKREVSLLQTALKQYEEMIEQQIKSILPNLTEDDFRRATFLGHERLSFPNSSIAFADFDTLVCELENDGVWEEIKGRFAALSGGAILDGMRRKDVKNMKIGERFPDRLRRCEIVKNDVNNPTAEIEMLLYMKECGYDGVPRISSKGEGIFEIEMSRGRWDDSYRRTNEKLAPAIRILSKIHKLSAEKLGAGKSYLHGPFYPSDICEDKIWHWQNCRIDEAFDDLAEALISLTDLCNSEYGRHDSQATMTAISVAFAEYEVAENVKKFGDRFCAWLDDRLQECEKKGNYDEHRRLSLARSFSAMNREKLNLICVPDWAEG